MSKRRGLDHMNNEFVAGIILGIGIGIGVMAVIEAKKAYDRHIRKQKIQGVWSEAKKAWNEATGEMN